MNDRIQGRVLHRGGHLRLALYAHYSKSGEVALYVLFYLRKLRELGFRICFISNSPIPEGKRQELEEICERVIERENTGFDFGMWQQALATIDLSDVDELLLTNSSVIGPLHPLATLWEHPALTRVDFWGLTDNDEFGRHLQSYFLVFRRTAFLHPSFREFWNSVQPTDDWELTIERYEAGLTQQLEQSGLKWTAVFPQEEMQTLFLKSHGILERLKFRVFRAKLPRNATMLLPDVLLDSGMPFLKTKLLAGRGNMHQQVSANFAMRLMESSSLPKEIVNDFIASFKER